MIVADTSSLVSYLNGDEAVDTPVFLRAMEEESLFLVPPVVTETLCHPGLGPHQQSVIQALPVLPLEDGYWVRAAHTRRMLLEKGLKARLGDALIAQSCIDHEVPLLTRDADFRYFAEHAGLRLV